MNFHISPWRCWRKNRWKISLLPPSSNPLGRQQFPFFPVRRGETDRNLLFFLYLYLMIKASHLYLGGHHRRSFLLGSGWILNKTKHSTAATMLVFHGCVQITRPTQKSRKMWQYFKNKMRSFDVYVVALMAVNWRLPTTASCRWPVSQASPPFLPQHVINMDAHTLIHTAQLAWRRPCWWTSTAQASPLFPVAREWRRRRRK